MAGVFKSRIVLLAVVWFLFFAVPTNAATIPSHPYPRLANYYLHWDLTEAKARELSRWHVVILDMETQARAPKLLKKMRQWNPSIVLIAYVTAQEIQRDAPTSYSIMRRRLASGIPNQWYVADPAGNRKSWWPGTYLLNLTGRCPQLNGENWQTYLSKFMARDVLGSGLWDGVFYDNAWDNLTYFTGPDVDIDRDGRTDANIDAEWQSGMRKLYDDTRVLTGNNYLILGNGNTKAYSADLNGLMLENFIPGAWKETMGAYARNEELAQNARVNIINANTANLGGENKYSLMRFGLASALLENGYYSFDFGDRDHAQTWRYDEYDVNLGAPVARAASSLGVAAYEPDVWQRPFERGVSLVNSTSEAKTIDLGGDYEKIHGTQDTVVNDGSIVSEVTVPAHDGLLLLRTVTRIDDVFMPNGSFARFFHADGSRARNGFFVFENEYAPGDRIARIDLDGNNARDLVVVSGNLLRAWRDDGQPLIRVYPYTANYAGQLRVAVGDVTGDGKREVLVAPSEGTNAPVKIYGWDGSMVKDDWYPFGKKYRSGYSLAVGNIVDAAKNHILVGTGRGIAPLVSLYADTFKKIREWRPFEAAFRGGVWVAAGDLDGNGIDEAVVGAGAGKKPVIRVFDGLGRRKGKEVAAYQTAGKPGIEVGTADVDFDGRDEIVAISGDVNE